MANSTGEKGTIFLWPHLLEFTVENFLFKFRKFAEVESFQLVNTPVEGLGFGENAHSPVPARRVTANGRRFRALEPSISEWAYHVCMNTHYMGMNSAVHPTDEASTVVNGLAW